MGALLSPLLFAAGCAILAALLLRRTYRRLGKRPRGAAGPPIEKQPRPDGPWDGARQDAAARFDRESVELHELARELHGQLDSKIVLLRELITQSERQIGRLESLLARGESPPGLVSSPPAGRDPVPEPHAVTQSP